MTQKPKRLPKLTDAERHKRFLETAREVEASEDPKDFDEAFSKVVSPKRPSKVSR
jgi:hypothetical protein